MENPYLWLSNVMQRRILEVVFHVSFFVRIPEVGAPGVTDGELVKAKHVHYSEKENFVFPTSTNLYFDTISFFIIVETENLNEWG
jgi:hypothetical protein